MLQKALEVLSGTWVQTRAEDNGHIVASDEYGIRPRLIIADTTFRVHNDDNELVLKGNFTVDPSKNPTQINWTDATGPDAGKTLRAIYALEYSEFVFCAADAHCDRPTDFVTGPGLTLRAFRRVVDPAI